MADTTLRTSNRRGSKARRTRNTHAWELLAGDRGQPCPYCGHSGGVHLMTSMKPYFYIEGHHGLTLVQPMNRAVITQLYCRRCAEENHTHQAVCYLAKHGVGETVYCDGTVSHGEKALD